MSEAFREFEHEGWQRAAKPYARAFALITSRTVEHLLDAVNARRGALLLDVAGGPGTVVGQAAQRGVLAASLDFSETMVSLARKNAPDQLHLRADADDLPFKDRAFDAAVSNFGLLHFAHPERAMRELARVTRALGRVGVTVWDEPQRNELFGMIYRALERHARIPDTIPKGPGFFQYSKNELLCQLIEEAGFDHPRANRIAWSVPIRDAPSLLKLFSDATVRTAAILKAQDKLTLSRIEDAVSAELEKFRSGAHFEVPIAALLGTGTKPDRTVAGKYPKWRPAPPA